MFVELSMTPIATILGRLNSVPHIGWDEAETGRDDDTGQMWRAFFCYDTSSIPTHADLVDVYFYIRRRGDPLGEPETYRLRFFLGTFVGPTLDGVQAEWIGGTYLFQLSSKPADKTKLDLYGGSVDPRPYVNKDGQTDLRVTDASQRIGGDAYWGTCFNADSTHLCRLIVEYYTPSATVTGKGFAELAPSVTRGASGTGTGIGSATLSANVTHDASATATGTGDASLAAGLLLATASATASGVGSGELAATVAHHASGTATGIGDAALAAVMTYSAGGTATGIGTATLGFYIPPLALDETTISVASSDVATISVVVRDSAEIAVDPDDVETRGPRRGN